MDAPEHTCFRRALGGRFSPKRVTRLAETIEQIVDDRLDAMERSQKPLDLQSVFSLPVALGTICHVLGIHVRPEWNSILDVMELDPPLEEDLLADYQQFLAAMTEEVSSLREAPHEGVLSFLLHDVGMTDEEVAGAGQFMVVAGHHTTSNMITLGTLVLQRDRRHWDAIAHGPDALPNMIEELIRYITVLQLAPFTRTATADVTIGDVLVRAGERVQVSSPAANRDPEVFERPDEFDPERDPTGHLTFGDGVHQCLGQHLARLELRIAFTRLVERFPDLRPAVPIDELEVNPGTYPGHGVHALPVAWGADDEGSTA
ncbi:cytochrome P450 [Georgenia halophila]